MTSDAMSSDAMSSDAMSSDDDGPLEADDFPIRTDRTKLKTQDGETIAEAKTRQLADCIAERLNTQAQHEEEDRWSA